MVSSTSNNKYKTLIVTFSKFQKSGMDNKMVTVRCITKISWKSKNETYF